MKNHISILILMLFLFLFCSHSNVFAKKQLAEQEALDILAAQIQKDKLYESWTTLSCLDFMTEEKTEDYFDFGVYEKHDGEMPGGSQYR